MTGSLNINGILSISILRTEAGSSLEPLVPSPEVGGPSWYIYEMKVLTGDIARLVEMLLKKGYRHVYMSRNFARQYNLVPPDLMPGLHGYGGLVKCVNATLLVSGV